MKELIEPLLAALGIAAPAFDHWLARARDAFYLVYLVGWGLVLVKLARGTPVLPRRDMWDRPGRLGRAGRGLAVLVAPLWAVIEGAFGLVGSVRRWRVARTEPSTAVIRGPAGASVGLVVIGAHLDTVSHLLCEVGQVRRGRAATGGRFRPGPDSARDELRELGAHLARQMTGQTSARVADNRITVTFGPDDRLRSLEVEDERVAFRGVPVVGLRWTALFDVAGDAYWVLERPGDAGPGLDPVMSPPLRADIAFPASGLRLSIRDDEAVMCTMTAPFAAAGKGMALMTPDEVKRVRRHVVDGHAGWREEETLRRRWHRTLEAGALVVTAAAVARVLAHGLLLAQAATLIAAATTGFLVIRYVLLRGLPAPIEIVRPLPRWLGSILWALGVRARSAATPRGSRRAP